MLNSVASVKQYAIKAHDDCNCSYGGEPYSKHLNLVHNAVVQFKSVFKFDTDYDYVRRAAYCHDLIEDARLTFNDLKENVGLTVAEIVLNVTDTPAESRLLRHLYTMPRTISDYKSIILKLADNYANVTYSKETKSTMFNKYKFEYEYRRPIFMKGLESYKQYLNPKELTIMWGLLDNVHEYKK